ncbi:MAG: SDR family oxidoreductase [Paracoccaceae bacterium]
MNFTNQTILVTGGTSGIGLELAKALQALGNTVIVTGRRQALLDQIVAQNPGMAAYPSDMTDAASIKTLVQTVLRNHPAVNVLINNAGIMQAEDLTADAVSTDTAEATITTNLVAPIRLTSALLPHFRSQPQAAVINVTSGLAFVPLMHTPTYNASKAALHSYTQSLRAQLRNTKVAVVELAPPAVQTDLMPGSATNPHYMLLADFIAEAVAKLTAQPTPDEVLVDRVLFLRNAESSGKFKETFAMLNQLA